MATVNEIQEKIDKTNMDIQKRMDRIYKLEDKEKKLLAKLESMGASIGRYDKEMARNMKRKPNTYGHYKYDIYADVLRDVTNNFDFIRDNQDVYSVYYDLSECIQNQFDSYNKIYDLEDKLTKLDAELQKAQVKQQEVEEIPPIIKELQNALYKELVDYDIELRDKIQDYYMENGRTETIKMYGKSLVDDLRGKSDSEIERDCAKAAEFYVLDLIHRVTKKIGKIIDYSGIYVNGPAINGVVVGERGTTRLETIIAGGAIQRTHYRVLLK